MFFLRQFNELHQTSTTLEIRGPDAYTYLQGQFTQDLNRPAGSAAYGLWLDQKGKVVADSTVLRRGDNDFIVTTLSAGAGVLRARLEACLVADEVELEDVSGAWCRLGAWGDGAVKAVGEFFGAAPGPGGFLATPAGLVFGGRMPAGESVEALVPRAEAGKVVGALVALGAKEADQATADLARISSGLVAVPGDIGPGDLPNEGGLDETAISYTKGCYLGQEVMARLKNLGQVRRRLHVVRGPGVCPPPHTALHQAGRKVGELRSGAAEGAGFVAMAMLSLVYLDPAGLLSVDASGRGEIRVVRRV